MNTLHAAIQSLPSIFRMTVPSSLKSWAAATGNAHREDARRWAEAIARLVDIDATLRDKARRLLAREFPAGAEGRHAPKQRSSPALSDIQREVVAFLATVAQLPRPA